MPVRKNRTTFSDYFAPADRAFTDWLARNSDTLLSSGSVEQRDRSGISTDDTALSAHQRWPIAPIDDGADFDSLTIFNGAVSDSLSIARETSSRRSAPLRQLAARLHDSSQGNRRASSTLFMDGMEGDARPGGAAPPGPHPEPPREVHPPLRETSRPPECEALRSHIWSLQESRDSYINERKSVLTSAAALHKDMSRLQAQLQDKRERLRTLEYQLRMLEQLWPPSIPRTPDPGKPGPIPDIIEHAIGNEMRRQIADVRRQMQHLENHMNFKGHQAMRVSERLQQIDAKLREVEMQLIEPEREYRLKCRNLSPRQHEWR
jgi:hypothetical protein